jgi:hypothetical protein
LVQVTDTVVLVSTFAEIRLVPAFEPKSSVAALMVHEAVMVIWTVRLAVAVPAWRSLHLRPAPG